LIIRISNLNTEKIDHQLWILTEPLLFGLPNGVITVPKGFITDGCSCPNILASLSCPMAGPQAEAAVLHDWLYSRDSGPGLRRDQADKIFKDAMVDNGTKPWKAALIYRGVRLGGMRSWKKCHSIDKIKEK